MSTSRRFGDFIWENRYLILLVMLLVQFIVPGIDQRGRSFYYDLSITGLCAAGLFLSVRNLRGRLILFGILLLFVATMWPLRLNIGELAQGHKTVLTLLLLNDFLTIGLLVLFQVSIMRGFFRMRRFSPDALVASLCVYLLMIVTWSFLYSAVCTARPLEDTMGIHELMREQGIVVDESMSVLVYHQECQFLLLYHSAVTQTTLGYGDITPKTNMARGLCVLQAVIGQIYLAVLVGGILGMFLADVQRRKQSDGSE